MEKLAKKGNTKTKYNIIMATEEYLPELAQMYRDMYLELMPEQCKKDIQSYIDRMKYFIKNYDVWVDTQLRGFFAIKEITDPITPNKILYDGMSVYIKPEYRKTKLLYYFYNCMFDNYKGDIIGFVAPNSEHLKVLKKRHKLLGFNYILERI